MISRKVKTRGILLAAKGWEEDGMDTPHWSCAEKHLLGWSKLHVMLHRHSVLEVWALNLGGRCDPGPMFLQADVHMRKVKTLVEG